MPDWLGWVLVAFVGVAVTLWLLGQFTAAANAIDYGVRWLRRRTERHRSLAAGAHPDDAAGGWMGTHVNGATFVVRPVGVVESSLKDRDTAPLQGDEGAPDAWLVFDSTVAEGLRGLQPGTQMVLLTWLDRARRDVLAVHPRGDRSRSEVGVFNTRSPDRPNPIGLHRVEILATEGTRVRVRDLEALDGTPIVDLKPVLRPTSER
jgi:tRNA-Thr(GGU) m(6)t(6)A37 methyltransferase TsaA